MLTVNSTSGTVVEIDGGIFFFLLLLLGAYLGWKHGFRSFLTVTLASTIAYFVFVSGGELILNYVNNIYVNVPRIIALFTGGDPVGAGTLDPLTIPVEFPLGLRILGFLASVGLSAHFNKKPNWYSNELKKPYMQELGLFTGALTSLIWTSAASVFWQDYIGTEGRSPSGLFGFINGLVGILPDVRTFVPFFILAFIVLLVVGVAMRLPNLFKP